LVLRAPDGVRSRPTNALSEHRERTNKNKRGWKKRKDVGKSLSFGDYDMDLGCPQRVPIYIRDAVVAIKEAS
jgi:hypothetical protein